MQVQVDLYKKQGLGSRLGFGVCRCKYYYCYLLMKDILFFPFPHCSHNYWELSPPFCHPCCTKARTGGNLYFHFVTIVDSAGLRPSVPSHWSLLILKWNFAGARSLGLHPWTYNFFRKRNWQDKCNRDDAWLLSCFKIFASETGTDPGRHLHLVTHYWDSFVNWPLRWN